MLFQQICIWTFVLMNLLFCKSKWISLHFQVIFLYFSYFDDDSFMFQTISLMLHNKIQYPLFPLFHTNSVGPLVCSILLFYFVICHSYFDDLQFILHKLMTIKHNNTGESRARNITGKIWLHVSQKCDKNKNARRP